MKKSSSTKTFFKKLLFSLAWAIWTGGILFLSQLLLSLVLSWFFRTFHINIQPTLAQAIYTLISYLLSILIIFFLPPKLIKKLPKVTKTELGLNELPTWTDIGLSIVGFIAYLLLAAALVSIFSAFTWFDVSETQDVGFGVVLSPVDRMIAFVILCVIAPIAEELVFRGFLYQKIKSLFFKKESDDQKPAKSEKRKIKSLKKQEILAISIATFITSLTFGVMHGQWNVGVNVFAMSIVLCLMREITGSIYAGIILHIIKNVIAFYLLYVAMISF